MRRWKESVRKVKGKLLKLGALISNEYAALLVIALHYALILECVYIPPLVLYACAARWHGCLVFWLAYYVWTRIDSRTLQTKGRRIRWLKNLASMAFRSLRKYFPIRVIKGGQLSSANNYILACFPHSILPFGASCNLVFDVNTIEELFPKLELRPVTLPIFFNFPVAREYLMALGIGATDEVTIKYWLNLEKSKAIILFPGGAKECLFSRPGNEVNIIKSRKGFVRIALQTGSWLVPVFTFGEHDTMDQTEIKFGLFGYLSNMVHKFTKFKLFIPKGRGFFQHYWGILPRRRTLTTVIGEPIPVPKVENPSQILIDEYHEKFYNALYDLFESKKHLYAETGCAAKLIMIEN